MKKLFINFVFCFFLLSTPAFATQSVKVTALTEFNSLAPVATMKVQLIQKAEFKNGLVFEDGTVLVGDIFDVKQPTRGKRNATFKFKPHTYLYNGRVGEINDPNFIAKYSEYKELDKKALATTAATTAGGMILNVPLLSQGVSLIKGMWKNEEDNRLKSGVIQVYKDSPVSYIEEGKDVIINRDTIFILKFKATDIEDLDSIEEQDTDIIVPDDTEPIIKQDVPVAPKTTDEVRPVSYINTVDPEDVLKEVELSTK